MVGSAMQCVVEGLGNFEKILTSGHDFPANVDAEFFGKWNEAIQDFSHTSADGGGIDHDHRTASKRFGERAEFGYFACADDGGVVIQRNPVRDLNRAHTFSFHDPQGEAAWRARCRACWCRYQCD